MAARAIDNSEQEASADSPLSENSIINSFRKITEEDILLTSEMSQLSKNIQESLDLLIDAQKNKDTVLLSAVGIVKGERDEILEKARIDAGVIREKARAAAAVAQENIENMHQEAIKLQDERNKIASLNLLNRTLPIDVGGKLFMTTVETVTKFPESRLARMFADRYSMTPLPSGFHFIDRDGHCFHNILNFLRAPHTWSPEILGYFEQQETIAEATFYGLEKEMFPFVSALPEVLRDQDGRDVLVTQTKQGLWLVRRKESRAAVTPVIFCQGCPAVYWQHEDIPNQFCSIAGFQQPPVMNNHMTTNSSNKTSKTADVINSRRNLVDSAQPLSSAFCICPRCGCGDKPSEDTLNNFT